MHCLVTGATGYIGGRLAPRLLEAGHSVRCLSRSAGRLRDVPWAGRVEVVEGDLADPASLPAAFAGVDVAYFLVHSLGQRGFERLDRTAAGNFAAAAAAAGVRRIIYLGGPEPPASVRQSAHLRSRTEVAEILLNSGVPAAVLRAAVILGSGSASFEMLRYLTERRDRNRLQVGEALDWWRVEEIEPGRLLRLRAEMKVPGRAWLEMSAEPAADGTSVYRQRAVFLPRGLAGHAYWASVLPFHGIVFAGMARNIANSALPR
jgi:hypothetical protein